MVGRVKFPLACDLGRHNNRTEVYTVRWQGVLEGKELSALLAAHHRPSYVLRVLTEIILGTRMGRGEVMPLLDGLQTFERCVASCERILRTPIPLSYTRYVYVINDKIRWLAFHPQD